MMGVCVFFFFCVPLVEGSRASISRSSWLGSSDARVELVGPFHGWRVRFGKEVMVQVVICTALAVSIVRTMEND